MFGGTGVSGCANYTAGGKNRYKFVLGAHSLTAVVKITQCKKKLIKLFNTTAANELNIKNKKNCSNVRDFA